MRIMEKQMETASLGVLQGFMSYSLSSLKGRFCRGLYWGVLWGLLREC